jgi:ketosteroid isomerase-like protein
MKRGLLAFLVLAFIMVSCEQKQDTTAVKSAIEKMDAQFAEAFNKKDVDGVMAPYWNSPDLITFYPDTTLRGYDALKDSWQKTFAMVDVKNFEFTESHVDVGDNMAYDWGLWTYSFQPKGGPEISMSNGRYLQVWAFKEGKWVVVADHASAPFSPPQPPAAPAAHKMGHMKRK